MKLLSATVLGILLLLGACKEAPAPPAADSTTAETATAARQFTTAESNPNEVSGTWTGQLRAGEPVSMFHYVGAESGDFAPMRFRNDSEAGRKILAACSNDDRCEFVGTVEWLDVPPPPDASAIGEIRRVDSARRVPPE